MIRLKSLLRGSTYRIQCSSGMPTLSLQHSEILDRLKQIIAGRVPVDTARLKPEATLKEIGIDSFSLIELVFLAEEEFKITIPSDGLSVDTVAEVLEVIAAQLVHCRADLRSAND